MKTTKFITPLLVLGLSAALTSGAFAQSSGPGPAAAPTQVYVAQLPTPTQLISAANAQQMSVDRIEQSGGQVTVVYRSVNGQTNTVTYLPLPANEASAASAPAVAAPTSSSTVVYTTPAPGYYPYYYPWGWYAPVAVGIGLGWGWGWHGGWHGGWRR